MITISQLGIFAVYFSIMLQKIKKNTLSYRDKYVHIYNFYSMYIQCFSFMNLFS